MTAKLLNPFPASSRLSIVALIDCTTISPILNNHITKYHDYTKRDGGFSTSRPLSIAMFSDLPSEDYELYHSSLSRIVAKGARFPVVINYPFRTRNSRGINTARPPAFFGFSLRAPDLVALRDELAKDFEDHLERRARMNAIKGQFRDSTLRFRPKIMFLHEVPVASADYIEQDLKDLFPNTITTSTALGFMLLDSRRLEQAPAHADSYEGEPKVVETFFFEK